MRGSEDQPIHLPALGDEQFLKGGFGSGPPDQLFGDRGRKDEEDKKAGSKYEERSKR